MNKFPLSSGQKALWLFYKLAPESWADNISFKFSRELSGKLLKLAQESQVSLYTLLLAAFKVLLYRYTGQEDILVISPFLEKKQRELTNLVVLRSNVSGNPTFAEFLAQVGQKVAGAIAHQDYPFELLVEKLQPQRDGSRAPISNVVFAVEDPRLNSGKMECRNLKWEELTDEDWDIIQQEGQFDLTLEMKLTGDSIGGAFKYNQDLFESETISRIAGHFQVLLEAIASNPQLIVNQLPLLTKLEEHQLLVEWNNTATEYLSDQCIHQLFEQQVEQTPDAVAVVFESEKLTYQELNDRANNLAYYLRSSGVGADVLVGLCMERSLNMVVAILAILKAGGAYVPLDPAYPLERLAFMLSDSQAEILVSQSQLIPQLADYQGRVISIDTDWEVIFSQSSHHLLNSVRPENLAYVIYTSGSTGRPKGVGMTHGALVNLICWQLEHTSISKKAKTLQFSPLSFDVSFQEIFTTWCGGGTLILISEEVRREPVALLQLLATQEVERLFLPFIALQQLTEVAESFNLLPGSLSEVITAGEQLQVTRAIANFFTKLPNCTLHNQYGPTETHVVTALTLPSSPQCWPTLPAIGRPIANTQIYLLDKFLQPVPIGVAGELYVGGVCLARGYINRPEITNARFISNPFNPEISSRLYKTGDLGRYLPDGNIEFLGRIDNQVKIRGFRIELAEIEAVLTQHPLVPEVAVIAREDVPGDKRLVAYIVTKTELPTVQELLKFLQGKLPEYMVPSAFVRLAAIPLTPSGKVDRRSLPAPDVSALVNSNTFVAPGTPTEELLATIWNEVLGLEQVGIHDNFLALGGHSLKAAQVISRIRGVFGVEIPVRDVFEFPTIAELAKLIERQEGSELKASAIVRVSREATLPLSFAQERLWFLDQLEGKSATYNIPTVLRLDGKLAVIALEQAITEIVRRHEVLRTTFKIQNGTAVQMIAPVAKIALPVIELQHLSKLKQAEEVQQLATQEAQQPFDLSQDSLLRVMLLRLSPESHVLLLAMHHIVSDGWSIGIFYQELQTLYQAFVQRESSPLPELAIQYADFTLWQRQWLSGEVLSSKLNYWKQQLAGVPPLLELPTDRPRSPVQTFRGSREFFQIDVELTQKLKQLSQTAGVTLFMTLLAAFATLLYRYSGQSDIVVGSPIANRNRSEIEPLIGFFVNTLALRIGLENNPSFASLLHQVRKVCLDAYGHQDLPFEKVVEALQLERNLSHSPLFQVMFVLQNAQNVTLELPGMSCQILEVESGVAKFDLTLEMEETSTGIKGELEYNSDLFDGARIRRMIGHFQVLLAAIVNNPQLGIDELPLLTAQEWHQLLVKWNDTRVDYSLDRCIHQLFEEQVEQTPDAVAVVFESEKLTYRQLNNRANQLAHYLQSLGVAPEVLVGICVERSIEMVVGLLGIIKAGGAYVALDPTYPQERIAYMLADSSLSVLLTQSKLVDSLTLSDAKVICLDTDWRQISSFNQENLLNLVKPDNLVYVNYTSGSTGKPKGVAIAHKSLSNFVQAIQVEYEIENSDRLLQFASISFDVAAEEIYSCLTAGATLVLRTDEMLSSVSRFVQKSQEWGITVWDLPTAYWQEITSQLETAALHLPQLLRLVIIGGEQVLPQAVKTWHKQVGDYPKLINSYGPTEATIGATICQLTAAIALQKEVPIGRAIANVQTYILDKNLQPVPIGVPGELHIGGICLALGYLNRPDLTYQKFIPNPFTQEKGVRIYKTGDLVQYLPDGNIEFLGRIDNQVKIRGFRIELGEIEAVLTQHPLLTEAVVIAREDIPGEKRLVAYIVANTKPPTVPELRDFMKTKLPEYMVPAAFVRLEAIPLTPNGKVSRHNLPAPDPSSLPTKIDFIAPRDAFELQLTQIWSEILNVAPIGVRDNFFDLGGHSLLAVRLMATIEQKFSKHLSLAALFQSPTVEKLAMLMHQETTDQSWSPLVAIQPDGEGLPFFWMPGSGGNVVYFHQLARHLRGDSPGETLREHPFYALQPPSLDGVSIPFERVEDIASYYIEAIQTIQLHSPYLLGGHSFGADVAFEMAQQLQERSEKVALLALLDHPARFANSTPKQLDWNDTQWLTVIASIIESLSGQSLSIDSATLDSLDYEGQLSYLKLRMEAVNLLPDNSDRKLVRGIIQTIKADELAFLSYVPKVGYQGRITLLRTSTLSEELAMFGEFPTDETWGWSQFSSLPVDVHILSGNHSTMLREPHVQVLAETLKLCLEQFN
ncbi:amino acid adenylation domain-containing protein [Dapis sp. BLCC M229]|uniref:amino acid adenylation domain-containing protein n=1 Tax=Dapis sp. BLCC M229 TaxID=3400188 RepID=UPI003CF7D379